MEINFKCVIKSTLFAVIITFILLMILACLSYFSSISENIITTGVYISIIAGGLLGAVAVSKAASSKAIIHAMIVCAIYALCLIIASLIINGGMSFNVRFFAIMAGIFASGFLGCIIGK